MRTLFITTQFPYPLDNGGKIGAINGLDLFRNDEVTILSFCEQPNLLQDGIKFLTERFPRFRIVNPIIQDIHIQKKKVKLIKTIICSYVGKHPYLVVKFRNKSMRKAIDKAFEKTNYDIVFIDYLNMQSYGDYVKKKYSDKYNLYILKDHNVEYEIVKQMAENASFLKKMVLTPIWRKTKEYEIDAIKQADIVLAVCNENAAFFRKYNPNSYAMLPAFDIVSKQYNPKPKNSTKLLYVGNLSWKPNMDGLSWFIEKVFPILKTKDDAITLDVIGSGAGNSHLSEVQGVKWHGFVEDISNVYQDHAVFIVPLCVGSGIRIKILEAFNNEIAVVSTSVGCNTIGVENEVQLLIADDVEHFADAVLRLVNDANFRVKLCERAKMFFEKKFSIDSRIAEFHKIVDAAKGRTN